MRETAAKWDIGQGGCKREREKMMTSVGRSGSLAGVETAQVCASMPCTWWD